MLVNTGTVYENNDNVIYLYIYIMGMVYKHKGTGLFI